MTLPYERVKDLLPFPLYSYQQEAVNDLAPLRRSALWLGVGTGKTLTSIAMALYKLFSGTSEQVVVVMPPVLLVNWSRVLSQVKGVSNVIYRGTPAQRKKIKLDATFVLVGYQIFRIDRDALLEKLAGRRLCFMADEAQHVKNVGSQTYKAYRDMSLEHESILLSGTPMSSPEDGYAMVKLITPDVYRTLKQFESIHVEERDFFDKVIAWRNLDVLKENLLLQAKRVLKEDVLKDLPDVTYTELVYELDSAHAKLYRQLVDEQLAVFSDGSKIDLTNVNALLHALQQVPANAEHFSEGAVSSTIYDLIEEIMHELGNGKLLIVTMYRLTNRMIGERLGAYGTRTLYGETKDRQSQIDAFVQDPKCRILVIQSTAGGAGIDGLQDVCQDILFLELPRTAAAFHQALGRVHRAGQKNGVNCRVAIAKGTLQSRLWGVVQEKDSLMNMVIRGPQDIRDALLGG